MHDPASSRPSADPIEQSIRSGRYRDAVGACARAHGTALGRFCMALLGNQAEADESVQETLIAAFDALPGFRFESSVRTFLFGIARHQCATRLAVRGRRERRLALVHDADEGPATPADLVEQRARAHRMRIALDELKPSDREALLLRYEAGLDFAEIGSLLGTPEATARKRVSRALVRLRDEFGEEAR